jgi:hypothetical protein
MDNAPICFIASFPNIQSAIRVPGDGGAHEHVQGVVYDQEKAGDAAVDDGLREHGHRSKCRD